MMLTPDVNTARDYAIKAHGAQMYGSPYSHHLDAVAQNKLAPQWVASTVVCSVLKIVAGLVGLTLGSVVLAQTPQRKWLEPFEFTVEERGQFTEALDKYPKRWMPDGIRPTPISAMRWLDDRRIVLSVRETPGWKARPDEPSHVVVVNTDTGSVEVTPYRGELQCLSHQGRLMIRLPSQGLLEGARETDDVWQKGEWSQPLTSIEWRKSNFIPAYLCDFFPYGSDLYSPDAASRDSKGHRDIPLLPQHGFLRESLARDERGALVRPIALHGPSGEITQLDGAPPLRDYMRYQPWSDTYFQSGTTLSGPTKILDPKGKRVSLFPPPLLLAWGKKNVGSARSHGVAVGVLWGVYANTGYWRKQGMYLETAAGLQRIDDGANGTEIEIAPDGCKAASYNRRWDPSARGGPSPRLLVIDLCSVDRK
jgi:hypothetical protein